MLTILTIIQVIASGIAGLATAGVSVIALRNLGQNISNNKKG